MLLAFEKWHGCRNDFIVAWLAETETSLVIPSLQRLAKQLCARDGSGISADGLIILVTAQKRDLHPTRLIIINSDGSTAKHCGNGVRCAAASVFRAWRADGKPKKEDMQVTFSVEGRPISCREVIGGRTGIIEVDMGEIIAGNMVAFQDAALARVKTEKIPGFEDANTFEIGNPHIAIKVEKFDAGTFYRVGSALQKSDCWDGMNVHFYVTAELTKNDQKRAQSDVGDEIAELVSAWPWERGVGPTQACGSGACSVAKMVTLEGFVSANAWVAIDMPGGRLYARQNEETQSMQLAGPATLVFSGAIEI